MKPPILSFKKGLSQLEKNELINLLVEILLIENDTVDDSVIMSHETKIKILNSVSIGLNRMQEKLGNIVKAIEKKS